MARPSLRGTTRYSNGLARADQAGGNGIHLHLVTISANKPSQHRLPSLTRFRSWPSVIDAKVWEIIRTAATERANLIIPATIEKDEGMKCYLAAVCTCACTGGLGALCAIPCLVKWCAPFPSSCSLQHHRALGRSHLRTPSLVPLQFTPHPPPRPSLPLSPSLSLSLAFPPLQHWALPSIPGSVCKDEC